MSRRRTHNLNLATAYVPDWGAWEVAREVACNAIDADPDGWTIDGHGTDVLQITTATVPDLSSLFVIGQGSKTPGGDTIGQFGEGIKMAALAATRMRPTGHGLVLQAPDATISFVFKKVLGVEALHAIVDPAENGPGFTAKLDLPGVVAAYRGKVMQGLAVGPMRRHEQDGMRVFIKGVYIATIKGTALWDWNLATLQTNRDRAMVSEFYARWAMGEWLQDHMTESQAKAILHNPTSIEANALEYHHETRHCRETLLGAFEAMHGVGTLLAVGGEADTVAARKGHSVAFIDNATLRQALGAAGVQSTLAATKKLYDLQPVDTAPYMAKIARLRELDPIVAAPAVRVQVFAVRNDDLRGWADWQQDMVLWLSEGLFTDGNDLELVRTYCHELGHFLTQALDGSQGFEAGLDGVAGRLGLHVLGGSL